MSTRVWHPYTRFSALGDLPVIVRGEGVHLFDDRGRRYIDGISSWWCVNLGHAHPRVVEAIQRQAARLPHSILGNLSHPRAIELAEALARLMPSPDRHVMFASDGASAVECALKVAVQHHHNLGCGQRTQFVALSDPYHGDTLGAVSVGYMREFHLAFEPLLFDTHRVPAPCERGEAHSLEALDQVLAAHHERIAGVVLETLCQGASGMRMYEPSFLAAVAERCRTHGLLLICDEIAMGFGRTGTMWAFEQAGVDPDIVCVGKGLSNGSLPISAAIVRDAIHESFTDAGERDRTFHHGHTFAGNPIAAAAALATLEVYRKEGVVEQAAAKGRFLAREMEGFRDLPDLVDLRCLGMVSALELDLPADRLAALRDALRADGLLLRPLGKVLYTMLPLITPESTIVQVLETIDRHLRT